MQIAEVGIRKAWRPGDQSHLVRSVPARSLLATQDIYDAGVSAMTSKSIQQMYLASRTGSQDGPGQPVSSNVAAGDTRAHFEVCNGEQAHLVRSIGKQEGWPDPDG